MTLKSIKDANISDNCHNNFHLYILKIALQILADFWSIFSKLFNKIGGPNNIDINNTPEDQVFTTINL